MDEKIIRKLIKNFLAKVNLREDVYNEFSLQHELGLFLRHHLDNQYKVQFERNIEFFELKKAKPKKKNGKKVYGNDNYFPKKEIDIVIYEDKGNPICAIELKYPRNGQIPEQMFKFCEDICFCEMLLNSGKFKYAFTLTLVEEKGFYQLTGQEKELNVIYNYFRSGPKRKPKVRKGNILKPTGASKDNVGFKIHNTYPIYWKSLKSHNNTNQNEKLKYFLIDVQKEKQN